MNFKYFTFLFPVMFVLACSPKLNLGYERTGMVTCDTYDKMTITLVSESQAESVRKAVDFAERNAIENLLFKGIPKSNQEKPLIANEYLAKNKHGDFLYDLIENKGYKTYVISSYIVNDITKGGVHLVTQEIKFDLTNLRRYLVSNNIIKKFGF